ncbi:MAG: hypothetical protein AAGA48_26475 [Myxococcota bacterium]
MGMRMGFGITLLVLATGCDELEGLIGDSNVFAPTGDLTSVELRKAPTVNQVLAWQCDELNLGPVLCSTVGPRPTSPELAFEFDLNFDLDNPNITVPIPMVEALLGVTLFDSANLGSVCVSFCDPNDDDCQAEADRPGACEADANDIQGPGDLIPSVPELLSLAIDSDDGTYENDDWRLLREGGTTRITMGFAIDPLELLRLGDNLLESSLNDLLAGREPSFDVPYTTEGTLFFNVPELGRQAIGFGPFEDSWPLEFNP